MSLTKPDSIHPPANTHISIANSVMKILFASVEYLLMPYKQHDNGPLFMVFLKLDAENFSKNSFHPGIVVFMTNLEWNVFN